jgi:hypothetical protein
LIVLVYLDDTRRYRYRAYIISQLPRRAPRARPAAARAATARCPMPTMIAAMERQRQRRLGSLSAHLVSRAEPENPMKAGAALRGLTTQRKGKPRPDGAVDVFVVEEEIVDGGGSPAAPLASGGDALVRSKAESPGVTRVMVHPTCSVPALLARLGAPPGAVLEYEGVALERHDDPLGRIPSALTEGAVLQLRPPPPDVALSSPQVVPGCASEPPQVVHSASEAFEVVQRTGTYYFSSRVSFPPREGVRAYLGESSFHS